MKKLYWIFLIGSAIIYGISFLCSEYLWWLVFIFPVPLLYITRQVNLSFIHGYVWGLFVFTLHLSGVMYVLICLSRETWAMGIIAGSIIILYQALMPGFLFWCATRINQFFILPIKAQLLVWNIVLWLFIMWIDWYSMWIFGIKEGYPLMHPLIPLSQKPALLCLLPYIGKQLVTIAFLFVPTSIVMMLWCKNYKTVLFFCGAIAPWIVCWWWGAKVNMQQACWHKKVKALPMMICSTAKNPAVAIKIAAHHLKNIVATYPETEIVIMPESAFNMSNFADLSELLQWWHEDYIGKKIHFIFGASRWHEGCYYNSLHWVYNGALQGCCDKRHAMLLSERLPLWIDGPIMQQLYFNQSCPIAISSCKRDKLVLPECGEFVPYICSELFFNEFPDDEYKDIPVIVIINDSLFSVNVWSLYIQKLLVLLARFRAIQWQRDIVYVSYAQSLFIDRHEVIHEINK